MKKEHIQELVDFAEDHFWTFDCWPLEFSYFENGNEIECSYQTIWPILESLFDINSGKLIDKNYTLTYPKLTINQ